jgi:hypothetical protein
MAWRVTYDQGNIHIPVEPLLPDGDVHRQQIPFM